MKFEYELIYSSLAISLFSLSDTLSLNKLFLKEDSIVLTLIEEQSVKSTGSDPKRF